MGEEVTLREVAPQLTVIGVASFGPLFAAVFASSVAWKMPLMVFGYLAGLALYVCLNEPERLA